MFYYVINLDMNKILNSIYGDQTVLVTGHSGFKGTWLTKWLLELNANVVGYSLKPNTSPSMFNILNLEEKITNYYADTRDTNKVLEVIDETKPKFIFHLASQPLVRKSYSDPYDTYSTNIMGLVNIFEAVRQTDKTKVIINVTTDKCYENKEWEYAYREIDRLGGHDPYSSSKAAAELVTTSYQKSFFHTDDSVNLASVRAGNVIGGGDWSKDRLIPDIIRAFVSDNNVELRNPNSIRPWQHVLEPLSGYLLLGSKMINNQRYNSGWNFGPNMGTDKNVREIAEMMLNKWKASQSKILKLKNENSLHEANYLKLDISKSLHKLQWKPIFSIEEAIDQTVYWYNSYYEGEEDMNSITHSQIENYVKISKMRGLNL